MTVVSAEPAYRRLPRVVGILGPSDPDLSGRVEAGPARDLTLHVRHRCATVWSSAPLLSWKTRDRAGVAWWAMRTVGRPAAWQEVAELWEALGLEMTERGATLHTASFGMQPLYTLKAGRALVFAQSIEDVCAVMSGALHADWSAWAAIFAFGSPIGNRTPFEEITRLPPGGSWHYDLGRDRLTAARRLPGVVERTSSSAPSPADVADRVSMSIKQSLGGSRWFASMRRWIVRPEPTRALTLSGGWDSRLLAACATSTLGTRSVVGYTTSPDDGLDLDLDLSAPVAQTLGIRHEIVESSSVAWPEYTRATMRRVEHQTRHHMWLEPLARIVRSAHDDVIDGLAGDVLLKNFMVDDRAIRAGGFRELGDALWSNLASVPGDSLPWAGRAVTAEIDRRSREDFDADRRLVDGHPAAATLSVLLSRTARCISLSPFGLFAPEMVPCVPFLHPAVVDATLAVPLADKAGGDFYRRVLDAADPALAALPSTNDPRPTGRRKLKIRATDRAALQWTESVISRMVERGALPASPDAAVADLTRSTVGRNWMKGVLTLGDWLDRYDDRLESVRAPWWGRS
jgi:hypothetical protein